MRRVRLILWALALVGLAAFAYLQLRQPAADAPRSAQPQVSFGGPFTLTGSDGRPFASSRLNGKPYAIFFGFTHCPDVCPTTLARLIRLRSQLGQGQEPFRIVFVSVDPERDRPQEVAQYLTLFPQPVIGLTGSPSEIDRVKRLFGIFSQKVPDGSGGYSVDHTATSLLFDSSGKFIATIAPEEPDAAALDKLRRAIGQAS